MLITLLYHRIGTVEGLCLNTFEKHLIYLKENFAFSTPDKFPLNKTSVLITFDDATYDFYAYVFPLLKKYQIPVTLAVCPGFTLDDLDLPSTKRLNFLEKDLFTNESKKHFCTYKELKEMQESNLVKIACHSFTHKNLEKESDLDKEIVHSKRILEEKLKCKIDTFVYPYGKFNQIVCDLVNQIYKYHFRIGSGVNFYRKKMLYRILCDRVTDISSVFRKSSLLVYGIKSLLNQLRGK